MCADDWVMVIIIHTKVYKLQLKPNIFDYRWIYKKISQIMIPKQGHFYI